jgi:NhaA family Na+:H+ antiporter
MDWRALSVVGLVAGIGFTMAIFIGQLAFAEVAHVETAKLAILVASGVAATLALLAGKLLLPATVSASAAATAAEAEASSDL